MSFTVVVTPFQLTATDTWTYQKFNQGFNPTVEVTGAFSALSDFNLIAATTKTFIVQSVADNILEATTNHGITAGQRVKVSSSGTLPAGLNASYEYFARPETSDPLQRFTLHYTYDDAIADTNRVDVTDAGTGTHTVTYYVYATGTPIIFNSSTSKFEAGIVTPENLPEFQGATTTAPGTRGAVPQPGPGATDDYLSRGGTWRALPDLPDLTNMVLFTYLNN